MQIQNLYKKLEFTIYILCIILTCAVCILLYADGNIRDEYNLSIDGLRLSQCLLMLILFDITFMISRSFFRNTIVKTIIMAAFIPVFLISSITIGNSVLLAKTIIQENKFRQTGFHQIHLNDLENIIAKEKTATILEMKEGIVSEAYFVEDIEKNYMNSQRTDQ